MAFPTPVNSIANRKRERNAFDSDAELRLPSISPNGSDDGVFDVKAFCCLLSR